MRAACAPRLRPLVAMAMSTLLAQRARDSRSTAFSTRTEQHLMRSMTAAVVTAIRTITERHSVIVRSKGTYDVLNAMVVNPELAANAAGERVLPAQHLAVTDASHPLL